VTLGVPSLVLSGNERDGTSLAQRLDDGRGWLRKDATGPELAAGIKGLLVVESPPGDRSSAFTFITIALLVIVAVLVIGYVLYLAVY
jgi:hypothetical protein